MFEGVLRAFEGYLKVAQRVLYFQTVEYFELTSERFIFIIHKEHNKEVAFIHKAAKSDDTLTSRL